MEKRVKLSKDIIFALAQIYILENGLEDYVEILNINKRVSTIGTYSYDYKCISMNINKNYHIWLQRMGLICEHHEPKDFFPHDLDANIYWKQLYYYPTNVLRELNIRLLHVLYHELVHAKQKKIMLESPNEELKSILLKEEEMVQNRYFYEKYHDEFVIEYNANVEGYNETHKLFKKLGYLDSDKILMLANYHPAKQYTYENNKLNSPYEKICKKAGVEVQNTDSFSFKDKILYGFPVPEKEYFEKIKGGKIC